MAGTKLVREERVPTVAIAEVADGDHASMSRDRRFKSLLVVDPVITGSGLDGINGFRPGADILNYLVFFTAPNDSSQM